MGAMKHFLCWLGLHEWHYTETLPPPPGKNWLKYAGRSCSLCGKGEINIGAGRHLENPHD